ncbi:MAG: isoaspartyl peptidase/L-asparaginase, partial [Psychroflexus sp.]|nr:isoaspartyl peptidase/L-asparaginase [Psychroflexus sp.]
EKNSLDASIMNGKTLDAGAIAGVTNVKNPINLADEVMKNSPHVLLSGEGAETFAKKQKLEIVDPPYFFTQNRYDALQRAKAKNKSSYYDPHIDETKYGTVGCVALDQNGNLAAGTSTGGMTNKKWGRIGDSPIIGAGTYANNKTCAVSSTGWGEYFMRGVVAYDISAQMEYAGKSLSEASKNVIQKLEDLGGNGGVIALDRNGNISMKFNTAGMYRASIDSQENLEVKMYRD